MTGATGATGTADETDETGAPGGPAGGTLPRWFVLAARVRGVAYSVGAVVFVVGMVLLLAGIGPRAVLGGAVAVAFARSPPRRARGSR